MPGRAEESPRQFCTHGSEGAMSRGQQRNGGGVCGRHTPVDMGAPGGHSVSGRAGAAHLATGLAGGQSHASHSSGCGAGGSEEE